MQLYFSSNGLKVPLGARAFWKNVPPAQPDPIFGLIDAYMKDPNPKKVSLTIGAYRDSHGKPYVFNCVRKAEDIIRKKNLDKEYFPLLGSAKFRKLTAELAYGDLCKKKLFATCQGLSGTGSLTIAANYLMKFGPKNKSIYLPSPTWINHAPVFVQAGLEIKYYRYYDQDAKALDFEGLKMDLEEAPNKSIILLQGAAHNPTGLDATKEQLREIFEIIKRKNHIIIIDLAYQGFATGDIDDDAFTPRELCRMDVPIILVQSFSKNMGLYGERIGLTSVMVNSEDELYNVENQLGLVARHLYSNPPINGARIVETILSSNELKEQWIEELKSVQGRIYSMRNTLKDLLEKKYHSHLSWRHITRQIGMFCYTGLTNAQVNEIIKKYSVYMTTDGRISVAGLYSDNVDYVAYSIYEVTKK